LSMVAMQLGGRGARQRKAGRIFVTKKPLILASESPRRRQYFDDLGLVYSISSSNVSEVLLEKEDPEGFAIRMAREKAMAVMSLYPGSWVVAADTVVTIDGAVLGKPADKSDAVAMLMRLSGREHSVWTGFCVGCVEEGTQIVDSVLTKVTFVDFSEEIARAYVATGEPLDKAGAYGIQGQGAFLVAALSGSYTNVVGLPLHEVIRCLSRLGVLGPAR
jgi:septum formation protein